MLLGRASTRLAAVALAAALAVVLAIAPSSALATVTVDSFTATPTTTAAGGHPDFTLNATFSYSDANDDLKGLVFHLPPGLVGNPQATGKCTKEQFEADACPPETQVGSTTVLSQVGPVPGDTSSDGKVYNLQPQGSEPALLGIVVAPLGGLGGKIFLTSPVNLRTSSDFGIDSSVDNQPRQVAGGLVDVTIHGLTLTLNGTAGAPPLPFMSNPTSCGPAQSVIEAFSYDAPDTRSSKADSFTPTDCDKLPFAPRVQASMGAPGATTAPAFSATITQAPGEANTKAATVTLPAELGANLSGQTVLCAPDQLAAGQCPADSKVGTGTVISPLLNAPLTGPAYGVANAGGLPKVAIALTGPLTFTLIGEVGLTQTIQIQNTFGGLPDVPLSSFRLDVDSGPRSLVNTARDLCSRPTPTVNGVFTGHNGATANVSAPITVVGCPNVNGLTGNRPTASATARGFRGKGRKARLSVTVKSAAGGTNLKKVSVKLPRDIRLKARRKGVSVRTAAALARRYWKLSKKGTLTVSLPDNGARSVNAKLGPKAVGPSKKLARRLKRKKSVTLRLVVTVTDPNGKKTTLRPKLRVKR